MTSVGVAVQPFELCGPLPTGVTLLEASAGTGKTFTIAALAARFVAEGLPLEHLLLVTFTRMATGELRDRVRERLVSADRGLTRALVGVEPDGHDDVLRLLAAGNTDEVTTRRDRLAAAVSDFDAATIATTHGFCQHVLSGLGVAGDVGRDVTFVEDPRNLVDEVVADLYVRKFHHADDDPPFRLATARKIGEKAVSNPDAVLEPAQAPRDSAADLRWRLASRIRQEVDRRRRLAGVLTYDDLLTRLRETLAHPERGEAACRRLRARYKVALVDEFQDTDPIQWEIMRRAFAEPGSGATLVLIGDPKQAIYAFRGADVYAYLDAAGLAASRATLQVNWRSDQGLLDAYDAVFGEARLGHEGIVYRDVRATDANQDRGMTGAPVDAPLRVRVLHREDGLVNLTAKGYLNAAGARACVAGDLAADVARLLSSGTEIPAPPGEESDTPSVPVRPGHIAVLVHRNRDAMAVHQALDAVGVPAVVNGAGSVFATRAAREWLRLLDALEHPSGGNPARTAALTAFLGWTAERVAKAGEEQWEDLHARLHGWAAVLRRQGVAALLETITISEGLARRVLERADGERHLTDVRHVGQLLHGVATAEQLGVTALTGWLRHRIAEAAEDTETEDGSRRLESDAEAVQVLTVYRSKGLEFPVVYCPYLWDPGWVPNDDLPVFHDPAAGDRRTIDVGGDTDKRWGPGLQNVVERRGEELRLAYVALTRAMHQAVVWWAPSWDSRDSPLYRLLFLRDDDGNVLPSGSSVPADHEMVERLTELAARAGDCISVERVDGGGGEAWASEVLAPAELAVSRFDRTLDPRWRRTSYTGITSAAHEARVASEAEEPLVSDEVLPFSRPGGSGPVASPMAAAADDDTGLRAVPSLLAAMPGGADVGTFVHGVLEGTDFTVPDLDAELAASLGRARAGRPVDVGDGATVVTGLRAAIETPLGPIVGDARLRDIARGDRIDELSFELPLVGGDSPSGSLIVAGIGRLLTAHLPAGDPLLGYAERLDDPALRTELRGYLSGSLDVVLRVHGDRYAVVDYKTNWLGADDEPLTAWHYRPAALAEAMYRAHYPLQALLYTVALHRYLRWRLPDYRAERNLAGVLYLFVRGMVGEGTPRVGGHPCGVFAWRPPGSLVEALSDLLDRGTARA